MLFGFREKLEANGWWIVILVGRSSIELPRQRQEKFLTIGYTYTWRKEKKNRNNTNFSEIHFHWIIIILKEYFIFIKITRIDEEFSRANCYTRVHGEFKRRNKANRVRVCVAIVWKEFLFLLDFNGKLI